MSVCSATAFVFCVLLSTGVYADRQQKTCTQTQPQSQPQPQINTQMSRVYKYRYTHTIRQTHIHTHTHTAPACVRTAHVESALYRIMLLDYILFFTGLAGVLCRGCTG